MKKNFIYALMSAIALTGAMGLSSCANNEEIVDVNPGYNPETGEVPVNFVMNISTENQGTTRMSAGTVQVKTGVTQPFRGIEKALLLTYKLKDNGDPDDGKHILSSSETNDKAYDLDLLIDANGLGADPLSRRVLTMSLPTYTNTLLFWGKAKKAALNDDNLSPASVYGDIVFSPSATLSDASFKLKPCVPDNQTNTGKAALIQYETLIETVLNKIVNAKGAVNETSGGKTVNKTMKWTDYVDFAADGTLTAKTYDPSTKVEDDPETTVDESYEVNMSPLGQILANTFITLNTFKPNELRNGQGIIIAELIGDVCATMAQITNEEQTIPTTVEEKAAVSVATYIQTEIHKFFNSNNNHKWQAIGTVKSNSEMAASDISLVEKDLQLFPDKIFRLPPGATILKYYAVDDQGAVVNEYHFMTNVPTYAMGATNGSFDPFNYMYPAELCYFGNSPIRVSNDQHDKDDYPDGVAQWDNDDYWTKDGTVQGIPNHNNSEDWSKDSHVISSTRSVAMQENINYGTALLKTTVKYASNIAGKLNDNNAGLHTGEGPNEIDIDGDAFKLTGILVGGQSQEVGWNFIPKSSTNFVTMVYDDQLPNTTIPASGTSEPNYTLVWDNYNANPVDDDSQPITSQNKVYIALQFENNSGKGFWGQNNFIRNGSSFYLIGLLDPDAITVEGKTSTQIKEDQSLGIDWPKKYALPPYDSNGTIKKRRVFMQDFMTTANFTIGKNSLKYALVSVPDLRSSQISLGLSVDLSWSQGLTFDDIVVGGN